MALTERKRLFAKAREEGKNCRESAIAAGCPEKTANQAGSRYERDPDVVALRRSIKAGIIGETGEDPYGFEKADDPKKFLRQVMNCAIAEMRDRLDAAKALLPYEHRKLGEMGKKEVKDEAAKEQANQGNFRVRTPPKLVR